MAAQYLVQRSAERTLIRAAGEIDGGNADELRLAGMSALQDDKPVDVDLSAVEFIDSMGLGALLTIRREAAAKSLDLRIEAASAPVRRVMELTGLDGLFGLGA